MYGAGPAIPCDSPRKIAGEPCAWRIEANRVQGRPPGECADRKSCDFLGIGLTRGETTVIMGRDAGSSGLIRAQRRQT